MTQVLKTKGRKLSYLLRHHPEQFNVKLSKQGYSKVEQILEVLCLTMDELELIASSDSKGRFKFNEDKNEIRASKGHSFDVDLGLLSKKPPKILYHGTVEKYMSSIKIEGLLKMSRNQVQLSDNLETAKQVASRRKTKSVILKIDSEKMYNDGIDFFLSENGVWLTNSVKPKYIIKDNEFNKEYTRWT